MCKADYITVMSGWIKNILLAVRRETRIGSFNRRERGREVLEPCVELGLGWRRGAAMRGRTAKGEESEQ